MSWEQFFSIIGYPIVFQTLGPTFFLVLLKNLTREPTTTPTRIYIHVQYKRAHEARVIPRVMILLLFEWSWKSRDVAKKWGPHNACSSTMFPESPQPNDFRHPLRTHALWLCVFFSLSLCFLSTFPVLVFSFLFIIKGNLLGNGKNITPSIFFKENVNKWIRVFFKGYKWYVCMILPSFYFKYIIHISMYIFDL